MLTDDEIKALLELEAKATPGPWYGDWEIVTEHGDPVARTDVSMASDPSESDNDGPLIISARNAIRPLAEEVLRLRAELAELRTEVDAERRAAEEERERDNAWCPRHGGANCDC